MKTMKCLIAALSFLMLGQYAMAQEPVQKKRGAQKQEIKEKRFQEFSEKIILREDQKEKIKQLLKEQSEQIKVQRNKADQSPDARKAAMKDILRNTDDRITSLLDDDQKARYKVYKAERKKELKKKAEERRKENEELHEEGLFLND